MAQLFSGDHALDRPTMSSSEPAPAQRDVRSASSHAERPMQPGVDQHDLGQTESKADEDDPVGAAAFKLGSTARSGELPQVCKTQRYSPPRKKVRELEAQLAKSETEFDDRLRQARAQAARTQTALEDIQKRLAYEKQLKEHEFDAYVREACAEAARKQTELEEMQKRLGHEKQLREEEGAKLRKANVMIKAKQQELKDLQAEHDRLQAIVEDYNAARLLAGGINIQADFPTLPEIEGKIRHALTVTASEWIEEARPALPPTVWIPWTLSHVFMECRKLVDGIVRQHTLFMEGGVGSDAGTMDEATADTFRQHVRRHHRTLFPLTGGDLQQACADVTSTLGNVLVPSFPDTWLPSEVGHELMNTRLDRVIAEYLHILVGATLQHPAAVFSDDLKTVEPFEATVHAESIDGDAVKNGVPCLVVFPSLLVKREEDQGFQPLTKPYILPATEIYASR